jgi:hypothetical protein
METFCASVSILAVLFLGVALIIVLAETGIALQAKRKALATAPEERPKLTDSASMESLAKLLEALKGLLLALKDLPAWFAIFLAGLALVWTATSAPNLCV